MDKCGFFSLWKNVEGVNSLFQGRRNILMRMVLCTGIGVVLLYGTVLVCKGHPWDYAKWLLIQGWPAYRGWWCTRIVQWNLSITVTLGTMLSGC